MQSFRLGRPPPLEEQLRPGEWFIFAGRPHWVRYLVPVSLAMSAVLTRVVLRSPTPAAALTILSVGIAALLLAEWWQSMFIVTNERVILHRGVVSRFTESIPLDQIGEIELLRAPMEAWFSTGRIRLTTTDGLTRSLGWIWRPRTFRRLALEQQKAFLDRQTAKAEGSRASIPPTA
jgi:uncharacterized membrane protein YdbT with pleckstrin-like domain